MEKEIKPETPENTKHLPPLLRLTRRACIFLFLSLIAFICFYLTGNNQKFLDSSIRLLLNAITYTAIALFFIALSALAETIYYLVRIRKLRFIFYGAFFFFNIIFSTISAILSLSISMVSEGLNI